MRFLAKLGILTSLTCVIGLQTSNATTYPKYQVLNPEHNWIKADPTNYSLPSGWNSGGEVFIGWVDAYGYEHYTDPNDDFLDIRATLGLDVRVIRCNIEDALIDKSTGELAGYAKMSWEQDINSGDFDPNVFFLVNIPGWEGSIKNVNHTTQENFAKKLSWAHVDPNTKGHLRAKLYDRIIGWYTADEPYYIIDPNDDTKCSTTETGDKRPTHIQVEDLNVNWLDEVEYWFQDTSQNPNAPIVNDLVGRPIFLNFGGEADVLPCQQQPYIDNCPSVDVFSHDTYNIYAKQDLLEIDYVPFYENFFTANFHAKVFDDGFTDSNGNILTKGNKFYKGIRDEVQYKNVYDFGNKPYLSNIQGFGYQCCGAEGTQTLFHRPPSYAEYRHLTFSTIANGAAGVWPWAGRVNYWPFLRPGEGFSNHYYDEHDALGGEDIDESTVSESDFYLESQNNIFGNTKQVFAELKLYEDVLINGDRRNNYIKTSIENTYPNDFIKTMFIENNGKYYLIAVNNSDPNDDPNDQVIDGVMNKLNNVKFFLEKPNEGWNKVTITDLDIYDYSANKHWDEIDPNQQTNLIFNGNQNYQHTIKFEEPLFEPGEVHIYKITEENVNSGFNFKYHTVNGVWYYNAIRGFDDIHAGSPVNYHPPNLYGWHYSDFTTYAQDGQMDFKGETGPWHVPAKGYSLPMAVNCFDEEIVINGKYRFNKENPSAWKDPNGWDDVNTPFCSSFDDWFHSDITIYDQDNSTILKI